MHRWDAMAEKIEQYKIIFALEFANHSAERIYLTRSASYEIPLSSLLYLTESFCCIALNILATYRSGKFLNGCGNIMFSSLFPYVVTTTYSMITLFDKLFAIFITYAATCTLRIVRDARLVEAIPIEFNRDKFLRATGCTNSTTIAIMYF